MSATSVFSGSPLSGSPFAAAGGGGLTSFGFEIPFGDPGEIEHAANGATVASAGFSFRAQDVRSAIGQALAGWEGSAQAAFADYADGTVAVLNANAEAFGRAGTVLAAFGRELEQAQRITREAASQCTYYQGQMNTALGRQQQYARSATTLYQQAATAAHPQMQGELMHQAGIAQGAADAAGRDADAARAEFEHWQAQGIKADQAYQHQAQAAAREIQAAAGQIRNVPALPGGAPIPISVSPSDIAFAKSILASSLNVPGSAWANPGQVLQMLARGEVTPSQVLALYKLTLQEKAKGTGSFWDALGGFVHTATFGAVNFGDPNTPRYRGGSLAAMIPIDPESWAVDGERLGAKLAEREGANAAEDASAGATAEAAGGASAARTDSFASGRRPHVAQVTVTRDGHTVVNETLTSGGMTAEERALGFPRSSLATHTEARAARNIPLQQGDQMVIKGSYPPCPACKGAMNQAARRSGATIRYEWPGGIWTAGGG